MLRRNRWVAPLAAGALSLTCGVASADGGTTHGWCASKQFCVSAGSSGTPGGSSSGGPAKGRPAGAKKGGKAPKCKVQRMDPQPDPGAFWYPGEGKVAYERTCPDGVTTHFAGAPGAAGPTVDPAVVAQQAVDSMKLVGPRVASPRADAKYVVGIPMWLWVTPSATTFGPNTATASAGGVSVTATAKVSKIAWSMGDGKKVICEGAGTPFKNTHNGIESPDCGHTYQEPSTHEPGQKYHLSATAYWDVTWQASTGEQGQIPTTRETDVAFTVGELQAVGS